MLDSRNSFGGIADLLPNESELLPPFFWPQRWTKIPHKRLLSSKILALGFIESIDLFLLDTVFFIISLGLYELFIGDTLEWPHWLVIHTLDDLKNKLIGVIVVVDVGRLSRPCSAMAR